MCVRAYNHHLVEFSVLVSWPRSNTLSRFRTTPSVLGEYILLRLGLRVRDRVYIVGEHIFLGLGSRVRARALGQREQVKDLSFWILGWGVDFSVSGLG